MGQIKTAKEAFLGQAEIMRMIYFLGDGGYKKHLKSLTSSPGVFVKSEFDNNFKITIGDFNDSLTLSQDSSAVDSDVNYIISKAFSNINPNLNEGYYGIRISYTSNNLEEGIVSISSDGTLTGTDTSFFSTLRGQVRDNANKIVFFDALTNTYYTPKFEVVKVESNLVAKIEGAFDQLPKTTGLKYSVIGTFTPGYSPTEEEEKIFEYDSCLFEYITLTKIPETITELPINEEGKQFYISAFFVNDSGTISQLTDLRSWFTYIGYSGGETDEKLDAFIAFATRKIMANEQKIENLTNLVQNIYSRTANINLNKWEIKEVEGGLTIAPNFPFIGEDGGNIVGENNKLYYPTYAWAGLKITPSGITAENIMAYSRGIFNNLYAGITRTTNLVRILCGAEIEVNGEAQVIRTVPYELEVGSQLSYNIASASVEEGSSWLSVSIESDQANNNTKILILNILENTESWDHGAPSVNGRVGRIYMVGGNGGTTNIYIKQRYKEENLNSQNFTISDSEIFFDYEGNRLDASEGNIISNSEIHLSILDTYTINVSGYGSETYNSRAGSENRNIWKITSLPDWINLDNYLGPDGESDFTVTVEENTLSASKTGVITINHPYWGNKTLIVNQDPK